MAEERMAKRRRIEERVELLNRRHGMWEDSENWARRITRLPQPERLVAIGDLHGDLEKAKRSLILAGVMDENEERWVGGNTVVVQVGDILDRGKDELQILLLLHSLHRQALEAGGQIITMLGNHEISNMLGDFKFTAEDAYEEFGLWKETAIKMGLETEEDYALSPSQLLKTPDKARAIAGGLKPGGPITRRFFAHSPAVLVVGSTVFVHGGLNGEHVKYGLERINAETRDWLLNWSTMRNRDILFHKKKGVTRMRRYSDPKKYEKVSKGSKESKKARYGTMVDEALGLIPGAKRMVVGHNVQERGAITLHFGDKVAAIDVGMSGKCGNNLAEVLEIDASDNVRVISHHGSFDADIYRRRTGPIRIRLVGTARSVL